MLSKIFIFGIFIMSVLSIAAFILVITNTFVNNSETYLYNGKQNLNNVDKKLNVIIPVRNRDKDLDKITDVLEDIFKKQGISAKYTIIEQEPGKAFNKAMISNAGFLEAEKDNYSANYLFQDVDVWPNDHTIINYRDVDSSSIRHPYGYDGCLGCFFLLTSEIFKKLNGYSNEYWGWGAEDTDIAYRAKILKIPIDQKNFIKRYSKQNKFSDDISHTGTKDPHKFKTSHDFLKIKQTQYKQNIQNIFMDGLSNVHYQVHTKYDYKNKPNMKRILISI
jgi:hypothetical protein